jgi:hypothetical protein
MNNRNHWRYETEREPALKRDVRGPPSRGHVVAV